LNTWCGTSVNVLFLPVLGGCEVMLIFESQREARAQTHRLLLAFAVTVALLVLAVNAALALAWGLMWGFWGPIGRDYPNYFFEVNTAVTLMFVLGGWWVETSHLASAGGQRLAERMGARLAQPSSRFEERQLANVVDEMALSSGLSRPTVMVLARDEGINAFAAGWSESDSVVAVTQGALEYLDREELQGLVAHELGHIREGDTRLNMRLVGMVFGLEMVYRMGESLWEPDDQRRIPHTAVLGLAIMAAGWLGWLAGHGLQAAVSRQREYLADARAVQWTRSRDGLGGVLRKILMQQRQNQVVRQLGATVQHMLLVSNESSKMAHWLDSHPTLDQRIRRLYGRSMEPLALERRSSAQAGDLAAAAAPSAVDETPKWTLS
jgi:heat shock protein HtpX